MGKVKVGIYARVSSKLKEGENPDNARQNPENQLLKLREYCKVKDWEYVEYVDYASGIKANRPQFKKLMADLQGYDGIIAVRIDRVGRSTQHLIDFLRLVKEQRKFFEATEQGIRIDGKKNDIMSDLLFRILSAVAEFERELIRERVLDGLERMRLKGSRSGRAIGHPRKFDTDRMLELLKTLTPSDAARELGVAESSVYARLAKVKQEQENTGIMGSVDANNTQVQ